MLLFYFLNSSRRYSMQWTASDRDFWKSVHFFFWLGDRFATITIYCVYVHCWKFTSRFFFLFVFSLSLHFLTIFCFSVYSCYSSLLPLLLLLFFFLKSFFFRVLLCFCLKRYTNTKTSNSIYKHQYDKYIYIYISLLHSFERNVCMYLCDLCHVKSTIHRQRRNYREGHKKTTILLAFESFMDRKSNRNTYIVIPTQ